MKVLVTGASGFLGSHVAEQLSSAGHDVRALVRKSSNKKFLETLPRVELAYGGIEDADKVAEACVGVDAIVHSAGIVKAKHPDDFAKTNVEGTRNVLEGAKAASGKNGAPNLKRFVLVSSLEAVGPSKDGSPVPIDQENPVTAYGRSKLEAEKVAKSYAKDLPITILRPTGIYGPRDVEIFEAFRSVKNGVLPLTGDGKSKLTLVYGPDAARACIAAIDANVPSGSTYFVTDGEVYEQREMMEELERAVGKKAFLRFGIPNGVIGVAARFVEAYGKVTDKAVMLTREKASMLAYPYWVCSSDATRDALGWKPEVTWKDGADKTARWYKENNWY
jgi:nucleoside-diphosphate-sugar epimerase